MYSGGRKKVYNFQNRITFLELVQTTWVFFLEAKRISLLSDMFRRFEKKNAIGRKSNKNSKRLFFNLFCETVMKIQKTCL